MDGLVHVQAEKDLKRHPLPLVRNAFAGIWGIYEIPLWQTREYFMKINRGPLSE